MTHNVQSQDNVNNEPWKKELQVLLGFRGDQVDGIMGEDTFTALKKFATDHDLTDVVLRGQFDDIRFWGFEQYLIKYKAYWIRETKNQRIIDDVQNKEYIRQAEETLYSFERAIQNAQLEAEHLEWAKSKAKRLALEKQELEKWEIEKEEAERLTTELAQAILLAEIEAEKWSLERIRAKRLVSEREQLERLSARKAEATRLIYELEDIIASAKREIDRLIEENKKMKQLIENSEKTETMAEELMNKLIKTNENLTEAQDQIEVLSIRNDTLEQKLIDTKIEIENMLKRKRKIQLKKLLKNVGFNINNNNLIENDSTIVHTINFDARYHLPFETNIFNKVIHWDISLEYSPSFTSNSMTTPLLSASIQNQLPLKWNIELGLKLGIANLSNYETVNYIYFAPEIKYKIPFQYKFISTYSFLSPQLMSPIGGSNGSLITYLNMGLRITID